MILKRTYSAGWGVFGELKNELGLVLCQTLEHAYPGPRGTIALMPKVPEGKYLCVRGIHQLAGAKEPFETFEVTGVPKRSGILFHTGNTYDDSSGCILLGDSIKDFHLVDSRKAFERFMQLLVGKQEFTLEVTDVPISAEKLS